VAASVGFRNPENAIYLKSIRTLVFGVPSEGVMFLHGIFGVLTSTFVRVNLKKIVHFSPTQSLEGQNQASRANQKTLKKNVISDLLLCNTDYNTLVALDPISRQRIVLSD